MSSPSWTRSLLVLEYPKLYSRVFEYITCSSHTTTPSHTLNPHTMLEARLASAAVLKKLLDGAFQAVGWSLVLIPRSSYQGVGYRLQPGSQRGGHCTYSASSPLPRHR
jgi:hypothetical protein